MPVGVVSEQGRERMVGVGWGGDTEALVDWTVGATGSGKTWHALSRALAVAETAGRGFLYLDPHRTAVWDLKGFLAARHADRILEIDLQATNMRGEPISAGWNPLDLSVVPQEMRKSRVDNLRGMLPKALFPTYFTSDGKSPQTATIIRNGLECLLHLNYVLPPRIQANIFCVENLLLDPSWRALAIAQLPLRDQKWWHHTFPMIVGQKGASSAALKPALNALEQWKSQERVQALLGASQTTLRWRDIIDGGKILLVVLNNDGSETDSLLARLIVGEMVAAFKERGLTHRNGKGMRPFHLFFDEFQSYAAVLEAQAGVMVQELRKFKAKVHFINQSPSALTRKMQDIILSNRTHLFCGRLGSPADAQIITKAMGTQPTTRHQQHDHHSPGSVESRDLLGLPNWHFICQITQNGELSSPFQIRGIDAERTWAHLKTDTDITHQITVNTGLQPVEQRLDHYDTLPERIAHWLDHQKLLTVEQVLDNQHQATTQPPPTTITPPYPQSNGSSPHQRDEPPASMPLTDMFTDWARDCLIEDPDATTPTSLLGVSYTQWCKRNRVEPLPDRKFQQLLTRTYGPSQTARINGKVTRIRRGIKLEPRNRNT